MKKRTPHLPEVNFSEDGRFRHLHLGTEWIQGSMQVDAPTALVHEYIQRMMAWLLFVEPASVADRQALQLGLGAASLTKFCHKELRIKTAAIELNPQVLVACRGWFKLAADDARLQVVLADHHHLCHAGPAHAPGSVSRGAAADCAAACAGGSAAADTVCASCCARRVDAGVSACTAAPSGD